MALRCRLAIPASRANGPSSQHTTSGHGATCYRSCYSTHRCFRMTPTGFRVDSVSRAQRVVRLTLADESHRPAPQATQDVRRARVERVKPFILFYVVLFHYHLCSHRQREVIQPVHQCVNHHNASSISLKVSGSGCDQTSSRACPSARVPRRRAPSRAPRLLHERPLRATSVHLDHVALGTR